MCESLLLHGGTLTADTAIKLTLSKSVLKYAFGDPIKVTEADFSRLAKAFFAEIESKYLG